MFDFTGEIQWDRPEGVRASPATSVTLPLNAAGRPRVNAGYPPPLLPLRRGRITPVCATPDTCAQIQIGHTLKIARLVGLEAAKRKVKAYVRIQHPFYQCKESGSHDEKEEVKPEGVMGTWWHETLRTLGAIEK